MEKATTTRGASRVFLSLLHCPYCGFALDIEATGVNVDLVEYGILRCACHEYPVIEGIPILQQIDGLARVVELVRHGKRLEALLRALDLFRVQWALHSKLHRLSYYWNCLRLVSRANASFFDAAHLVRRPRVFADYLIHRYANPSFLAAIGPLMLLDHVVKPAQPGAHETNRDVRVLDLACGAGHASFLMRTLHPGLRVVSADQDFVSVYLARRYMAPDAMHLCIDAQVPSPFPDKYFDAVFCQDAFHYFKSKKTVVREMKRISQPDAVWVFPHLHNRLCHNLVPGLPLSPESYLECFDLPDARMFSESELLQGLVHERAVDLSVSVPPSNLNESPTLTLIRGGAEVWRVYKDFPRLLRERKANLRVNPIYRSRRQQGECRLELQWPNPVIGKECAEVKNILPQTCHLSAAQLAQLGRENTSSNMEWLEELVAKFVLVALPRGYICDKESALVPA